MPKKKEPVSTQSVGLKNVKKKSSKKEFCDPKSHCSIGLIKLSSMAFILFLINVWPKVGAALLKVHWGWYLGIFVVLGFGALGVHTNCCKK